MLLFFMLFDKPESDLQEPATFTIPSEKTNEVVHGLHGITISVLLESGQS